VLTRCLDLPVSGIAYLKSDVDLISMNQWTGKIELNTTRYNISYKNFVHRGSINHDVSELVCMVLYTSIRVECCSVQPEATGNRSVSHPSEVKTPRTATEHRTDGALFSRVGVLGNRSWSQRGLYARHTIDGAAADSKLLIEIGSERHPQPAVPRYVHL